MAELKQVLATLGILILYGIIFGKYATMINAGVVGFGQALGILLTNTMFILALGLGGVMLWFLAERLRKTKTIDANSYPFLVVLTLTVVFIWKAPSFALFSFLDPSMSLPELNLATVAMFIAVLTGSIVIYHKAVEPIGNMIKRW